MPLSHEQIQECLAATGSFISKRRPPPELRDRVDYRALIVGSEVKLVCVRPHFQDESRKIEHPFAKVRWIAAQQKWRLYWMRADLKWHSYQPLPEAKSLAKILDEVDRDPHCCFFG